MNPRDICTETRQHTAPQALRTRTLAQQTAGVLMEQCFIASPGRLRAWLIFDATTQGGLLFVRGRVQPSRKRLKRVAHLLGVAEVDPTTELLTAVAAHGPEGLRWNGETVTLAGH